MLKIVGISACSTGVAHTYIAKEKLETAARNRGHDVKIETHGGIGVENRLTPAEIEEADIVIIAADIRIGKERFKGKPIVEIPTSVVMKSANSLIMKIEEKLNKKEEQ